MQDALFVHRLHFGFTITYHYIFPQFTMGLAPLIVVFKTLALRTGDPITVWFHHQDSIKALTPLCEEASGPSDPKDAPFMSVARSVLNRLRPQYPEAVLFITDRNGHITSIE